MAATLQLQSFIIGDHTMNLFVPDANHVKELYQQQISSDPSTPFPYWTKVWPSAIALTQFILQNPSFIQHKKLLELAAGLGLPSIAAARFASAVCCSDYLPQAVSVAKESINYLQLKNVHCIQLNWEHLPEDIGADILLLSDINYNPDAFDILYAVIMRFINKGTTVLLSTPQRLSSKPFIEKLLHCCVSQQEIAVVENQQTVMITVMVLKK